MNLLYIATAFALLVSLIANHRKTIKAFRIAFRKFVHIMPAFLTMLIMVSIVLHLVPDKVISSYLGGDDKAVGILLASILGSITLMPGFIAFPLCGVLLQKGVQYMILSAFSTTLMMVGILTYPVEKEYFGTKVTIIRNAIGLLIALCVSMATGIFFGEISW